MKRYQSLFVLLIVAVITGIMTLFSSAISAPESCQYHEEAYQGLNLSNLSTELENTGLIGTIHGSVPGENLYVLSVRDPDNFFEFRHLSLISGNKKIQKTLSKAKRHDQICLQGKLINNPSPQPHVIVKSANIMESWQGLEGYDKYEHEAKIPEELKYKNSAIFKVHAINDQGKILVVEYKDKVIPMFVETPELTKDLYRGDVIEINYLIQSWPHQPTHFKLNMTAKYPIKVIDQLVAKQEQEETLKGALVKFPQSPQIKFDVYAIEVINQEIPRFYTLVNFEDRQKFKNIRLKLKEIWNNNLDSIKPGRNFLN